MNVGNQFFGNSCVGQNPTARFEKGTHETYAHQ